MIESKKIFVHIGYPKTATTTLQKFLFPSHSQIKYLRSGNNKFSFIRDIFFSRENHIKRNADKIRDELEKCITNEDDTYVYSEESLTSFSMFFRFQPTPYIWTIEPNSVARKVKMAFKETEVFNEVKIIVTIRKQDDMLKSMYAQVYNLVFKKFRETNTFEKFLKYSIDKNSDNFIIDALHYNNVIQEYENLFGKENILVLVFEELKENKEAYIKKLCNFMGIDYEEALKLVESKHTNTRSSDIGYRSDERNMIELLSYYKKKYLGNKSLGLSNLWFFNFLKKIYIPGKVLKDIHIDEGYVDKLNKFYGKGNKALSQRYNLNLKEYGYYDE